ncbi:MAG: M20/M25/M40 family metallo-hydrolase [Bacteroidetes bacterium]|nr:M20/M25/M40 family metallo-hydrolase [Bacteroidota bacterium]
MVRRAAVLITGFLLGHAVVHAQRPAIQQMLDAVDADSLVWRLERLSGELPVNVGEGDTLILSRHKSQPGNALAAQWLRQELQRMGYAPAVEHFGGAGENILAVKAGALHPERKVYISAHYDCMPGVAVAPGADDDGSGVCAVLEAARVMADMDFENTVVFALWDEEEQGMLGSAYHAAAAAGNDELVAAVVQMDAIAYDGNGDGLLRIHARPVANSIAIKDSALMVNTTYGPGLPIAVNNPGATYSDHASFWSEGYGAILLVEDFDNDPNPHYHTPNDRMAYLDTGYWRGITQLAIGTAAAMAVPTGPAGVGQAVSRVELKVFPNPAAGEVHVQVAGASPGAQCSLVDATGRPVRNWSGPVPAGGLVLKGLPPGTYLLRVQEAAMHAVQRIVVLP